MFPFLFPSSEFPIPTFYLMMLCASIFGTLTVCYFGSRMGLPRTIMIDVGLIGSVTGVIGARIFHIVIEYPWYYLENPTYVWQIWRGGLVWYGGMILAVFCVIGYLRLRKQPILPYLDIALTACSVILLFGRIGCLSAGCCYGEPTHLPWGITFPAGSEAGKFYVAVPLHPTQMYEILAMILIGVACSWNEFHKKFNGETASLFLVLYSILRSVIEIFRGDADRGVSSSGLSTSQIISLITFSSGVALYFYLKRQSRRASNLPT